MTEIVCVAAMLKDGTECFMPLAEILAGVEPGAYRVTDRSTLKPYPDPVRDARVHTVLGCRRPTVAEEYARQMYNDYARRYSRSVCMRCGHFTDTWPHMMGCSRGGRR